MPKRSSKKPAEPDINQLAVRIVSEATSDAEKPAQKPEEPPAIDPAVSAAAAALGRRGGLKGGPARAAALSPTKRRAIARKAAAARWEKKP